MSTTLINTAAEFLQALEQVGSSCDADTSSYVAQERFMANKNLIKERFGGDVSLLEKVVVDLMDSTKTPLIREQRVGVKLAINQQVNKSGLRSLLLSDQSRMLSDLIASHIHQIFNQEELLNLFNDETLSIMSEHTRIRVERTIRTECKSLILNVVRKILGKVKPSECFVLVSHLPTSTPSDSILEILNELKIDEISGSVIIRRHPQVVAQFIRQELDKTIKGALPQASLWNLLISTLNELSTVFSTLSKVSPTLAFSIIDEYFVQYALKENIPVDAVQSYLMLKVKNFPETFKSCINSKSRITFNLNQLFKMFSVEDISGIYLKKIETLNYATSPESMTFFRSFEVYGHRDAKKVQVLTRKLINKGVSVEKLSEWIFQNVQPSTEIPSFLKYFPIPVISSVTSKLYEVRKLKDFATPDLETKYWRYLNMVDDEASYKKFKGLCSNSQSNVRINVLMDLFFCSLLHNKRVKETLEFIDSRLKNDVESIPTVISSLHNDTFFSTKVFGLYKNEELRDLFHTLLENTAKKFDSPWYYNSFFGVVFRYFQDNVDVLKFLVERNSKFSKFVDLHFLSQYGITLKPDVHKTLTELALPIIENRIESDGDMYVLKGVLRLGEYKKQPEYVQTLYKKFFGEWLSIISKKGIQFAQITEIADLYFKGLNKKTAIEQMKKLVSHEAGFFLCERVQRLLLSRSSPFDKDFVFQFVKEKALTSSELQSLSTSGFIHTEYVATILPTILFGLRIGDYSSPELTKRLISTYKDLLLRCGRGNPLRIGTYYFSDSSLCKLMIKALAKVAVESSEMKELIEFFETKFLPKDAKSDDKNEDAESSEENEEENVKDVEDNATRCLASLVRIYSQKPVEHLQYVLENINSENVLYYFSAIGRISTFFNDLQFVDNYCSILKKQFTEALTSKQPLPTNMTIVVQKMLINRLKAYTQHLNSDITARIVDTLIEIWNLKPQKDVQVAIVTTILSAIKNDRTDKLFNKAKSVLEQVASHEYEDIVLALASFSIAKNVSTMREIFLLRLKTLEHPVSKIQTSSWSIVSSSVTSPSFIKKVVSESFNPISLLRNYIIDAVLNFNPQQQHTISNVAIEVIIKEVIETPDEASSVLFDRILVPLLTEEKYKELDRETYNADIAWDRPVKARLSYIVNSLSTKVAYSYQLIPEYKKEVIQTKIVTPLIEIVKEHVQNRFPYACIVSSIRTNWTDADSVIQNSIKNVADLFSDVEEPLKSLSLAKIVSHSGQITLNRSQSNVLLEAVSKVLNSASEYSQTEQIIATGILMSLGTSDEQSRSLKKIARKNRVLNFLTE